VGAASAVATAAQEAAPPPLTYEAASTHYLDPDAAYWAGQQHVRSGNPNPYDLGLDDVEYPAALARAAEPEAGQ
jgi:hypothetical protein